LFSFVAALATANARIASLEAELRASQKAYDAAAAAKVKAEKSQKAALGKAKTAEKALADADKEHAQRERAVAERLHTISTAAESEYLSTCSLFSTSVILVDFADTCVFICFAGFTGVSSSSLPTDDDPLMDAVNLLEANWISIQETFELVSRVLSRLFTLLWPKRKAAMPKENLTELVKSFDTVEEPTLHFKALSIKRGAESAIALSLAHGTDFDWGKVSSPHGHTRDGMKVFFEKAKKLAPALLNTISPSAASAVPAATPAVAEDPVPPSTSGEDVVAPSSAPEHNAEVA
jgi:hypothetical protein